MKIEMEVAVKKDAPSKRSALLGAIDIALILNGVRVSAGRWSVVLEHLPPEAAAVEEGGA